MGVYKLSFSDGGESRSNSISETMEKLRQCGGIETFSITRHSFDFYNGVGVTAHFSRNNSTQALSLESLIFAVLRVLINRYAILSAIPAEEYKNVPYFVRLPSVDLRTCTVFIERLKAFVSTEAGENDDELAEVLEAQHKLNWKDVGAKPFWRLVVLHNPGENQSQFTASWIFHHAISDGTSGKVFFRAFLTALNSFNPNEPLTDSPIVESPKKDLLPPLEQLHPLPLTWSFIIKQFWNGLPGKSHRGLWTGAKIVPDPNSSTLKLRTITFSKAATTALIERCRQNKSTLTSMLETVMASAILATLPLRYDRVTVNGALSLRRFLTLPDRDIEDEIGVYPSSYYSSHTRSASSSVAPTTALSIFTWTRAHLIHKIITAELSHNGSNSVVASLRWIGNQNTFWSRKIGTQRANTLELTNIGKWCAGKDEEGSGEWKVGRVTFSQDCAGCGPVFAASVATGGDGCCVVAFEWKENAMEGVSGEEVVREVRSCLEALAMGMGKE